MKQKIAQTITYVNERTKKKNHLLRLTVSFAISAHLADALVLREIDACREKKKKHTQRGSKQITIEEENDKHKTKKKLYG